ncbi:hypothetical protein G9A89_022743 [Geosiphon pyriformis]|nr:hypothetical protein G9A89_022743 [Geosiphon pyriformis]
MKNLKRYFSNLLRRNKVNKSEESSYHKIDELPPKPSEYTNEYLRYSKKIVNPQVFQKNVMIEFHSLINQQKSYHDEEPSSFTESNFSAQNTMPPYCIKRIPSLCRTLHKFRAREPIELSFEADWILYVLYVEADEGAEWWLCFNPETRERGWVDPGFCERVRWISRDVKSWKCL